MAARRRARPTPSAEASSDMHRRLIRAAEYRRLAIMAGAMAETSLLDHVRGKHEAAAARWTALQLMNEEAPAHPFAPPL